MYSCIGGSSTWSKGPGISTRFEASGSGCGVADAYVDDISAMGVVLVSVDAKRDNAGFGRKGSLLRMGHDIEDAAVTCLLLPGHDRIWGTGEDDIYEVMSI